MKFFLRYCFVLIIVSITSCRSDCADSDVELSTDKVLVSNELGTTISQLYVQQFIALLGKQYSEALALSSQIKSGVNVYKVTYNTTFQGSDLLASGVVAVPSAAGIYPVISFQNGTNVLYDEAPSKSFSLNLNDTENTIVVLESMASLGFVVVIADYPGFGSSESVFHPYLEKENTIPSLTDLLLATNELLAKNEIEAKLNGELFIVGYSQGGWSTMQLLKEIETNPLQEFNLKAASCGAGPYNLTHMNQYVLTQETYPMPYYLGYLLQAYNVHGLFSNPISDFFAVPYAAKIPELFDFQTSGGQINQELTYQVSGLFKAEYINGFSTESDYAAVRSALESNSIAAWNLKTPTKLFHGDSDLYIPIEISQRFLADFRELGVAESQLELVTIAGADHSGGVLPFGLETINWFLSFEN